MQGEAFSLKEWSDARPGQSGPREGTYRWMGAEGTLLLGPVRPGRPLVLHLRMFSGRPAGDAWPEVRLSVDGRPRAAWRLGPTLQDYSALLPPEDLTGERLRATLQIETFRAGEDTRDLGLVVESARLETGAGVGKGIFSLRGLVPTYAVTACAAAVLAYLGLRGIGCRMGSARAAWLALGLGARMPAVAAVGARLRPELVLHAGPTLAVWLALAAVSAGAVELAGPRFSAWAKRLGEHAEILLLVLFLGGMLLCFFPHIESDGIEYYAYLRSLAFDGNLHFNNELSLETPFPHVPYGPWGRNRPSPAMSPTMLLSAPPSSGRPFSPSATSSPWAGMPWGWTGRSTGTLVLIDASFPLCYTGPHYWVQTNLERNGQTTWLPSHLK